MKVYLTSRFERMANFISDWLGSSEAFLLACLLILIWAALGPYFNFSEAYQLVVNTGTTIVTFLMMFLLQHTGNRTIEEQQTRLRTIEEQNRELLTLLRHGFVPDYSALPDEIPECEHTQALIANSTSLWKSESI